ncbi:MAG: hypothetical protein A2096_16335 [Spirochaetes bacterium GWF1_41_5]|nr:MAG: hypothetical protein A2096_16335 [Spirochaetes bacterium GWF1_41_5]
MLFSAIFFNKYSVIIRAKIGVFIFLFFYTGILLFSERPPHPEFELAEMAVAQNRIDEITIPKLKAAGISPSYLCSDEVFLRRVYLDLTGLLPFSQEVRKFKAVNSREKRRQIVERLLNSEAFALYQTMRWGDILRIKSEFPINLWPNAVQAYHRWILAAVRNNMPYDEFVRALLTASGSNFRDPPVNFFRAVQKKDPVVLAQTAGLIFMGVRPETWKKQEIDGLAGFFSKVAYKGTAEWKEEIVYYNPDKPWDGSPVFPGGKPAAFITGTDPRRQFADWLITSENPWFSKAIVNRIWFWLMGRGIIHEPDDIRPDNPSQNEELLSWLTSELAVNKYDLKHIFRIIMNSAVYQQSSIPLNPLPGDECKYAFYNIRRLGSEELIDNICRITGTSELYSSPIPEPFTFIPQDQRSISIADGSISSSFLELFGRPSRDTGLLLERNNTSSAEQKLHMLNSTHVQEKIKTGGNLKRILTQIKEPEKQLEELYLSILTRYPSEAEKAAAFNYFQGKKLNESQVDLTWALFNTSEFINRH